MTAETRIEDITSTNNKEGGCSDTNESSDNEPLIKVSEKALQVDKVESSPLEKNVHKEDHNSSDDEPLSALARKLKPKPPNEANVKNSRAASQVVKSKRTATRTRVTLAELSSDSSDNETPAPVKRKLIKTDLVQKASPKQKKAKLRENSPRECSDPSSEDEPLINLVKKRQAQSKEKTSEKKDAKSKRLDKKHLTGSRLDDDEEAPANRVVKIKSGKENTTAKSKLQGETRSPKKQKEKRVADSSSDDDDLPLMALKAKMMLRKESAKKVDPQVHASRQREEIPEESSEDEPLIHLVKKRKVKTQQRKTRNPKKQEEKGVAGKVREESSENEPLINLVKKRKVRPTVKTPQTKTKSPKKQEEVHVADLSLDCSSDDEDLPLVELKAKMMLAKESTKRKDELQVSPRRKKQGISDPSSEDEPFINLVKERRAQSKVKAPQKNETPTVLRGQRVHGSTSNWSDDKPVKKDANHPRLTKFVKIILGRCDGEETARSYDQTGYEHAADVCYAIA